MKRDIFYSISEARPTLKYTRQYKDIDEEFYYIFRIHVEAFEHFVGNIGHDDVLLQELMDDTDPKNPAVMPTDEGTSVV